MLTYYRLKHTQARFDPRVQGEWSLTNETQSEFCLVLMQGVGVKIEAYSDGQEALSEFISTPALHGLKQGGRREHIETILRRYGINPGEVAA